jgi:hypothetical protein
MREKQTMNAPRWQDVRRELGRHAITAPGRDRAAFWQEFRARAALAPQAPAGTAPAPAPLRLPWPRLVAALSAAAAAAALTFVLLHGSAGPIAPSTIKSYQVLAPHAAVIILSDAERAGTILWVADGAAAG